MGSAPHHASHISSKKLLCRWRVLPIAFAHVNQKMCSIDGEHSLCGTSSNQISASCEFSSYLRPHGSELIENSASN
jgi:hypothetical protein